MNTITRSTLPMLLGLGIATAALAQIDPLGEATQVNTLTTDDQRVPSIALGPDGESYLVVWRNDGGLAPDTSGSAISGQRFDRNGNPLGVEFLVNELTTGSQSHPSVAAAPDGDYIVVWSNAAATSTDPDNSIRGRIFAADGSPRGEELQINSYTTFSARWPEVDVDEDGDFVVIWQVQTFDGLIFDSLRGRRFEADGTPKELDFQIGEEPDTAYPPIFEQPALDVGSGGEFTVAWSYNSTGKDSIQYTRARQFDSAGQSGPELVVDTTIPEYFFSGLDVAHREDGEFIVVWSRTNGKPIELRRILPDGSIADQQIVDLGGSDPNIEQSSDGDFLVVWKAEDAPHKGRAYSNEGKPISDVTLLHDLPGSLPESDLAMDNGGIVLTWSSETSAGTDQDGRSIQQRRFRPFSASIFADGFESGDTSAWVEGSVP